MIILKIKPNCFAKSIWCYACGMIICVETEFGMFLAFVMVIGLLRLDRNDIIIQNHVLQNYADSLIECVLVSDLVVAE